MYFGSNEKFLHLFLKKKIRTEKTGQKKDHSHFLPKVKAFEKYPIVS